MTLPQTEEEWMSNILGLIRQLSGLSGEPLKKGVRRISRKATRAVALGQRPLLDDDVRILKQELPPWVKEEIEANKPLCEILGPILLD